MTAIEPFTLVNQSLFKKPQKANDYSDKVTKKDDKNRHVPKPDNKPDNSR